MYTTALVSTIVAAVAATTSAVVEGVQAHQAGKVQEAQNNYNAAQEREAQKQAFQEESLNSSQHYRAVRHEIATGQNMMAGFGNVGTSQESALRGAYFNMSEDLSAIRYRYGAEAAKHENAALNYKYNAAVAKKNRRIGVLGSAIKTVGSAAKGVASVYGGGYLSSAPKTTFSGAVDSSGMYGAWAG